MSEVGLDGAVGRQFVVGGCWVHAMKVAFLFLDDSPLLDDELLDDLKSYVNVLLHVDVEYLEIPELPIAPKGWQALMERARQPLKHRAGRAGSNVEWQLHVPHLLECLRNLQFEPEKFKVPELAGVSCILGFTNSELYFETDGLLPEEPVPETRTRNYFVCQARRSLGVCSLACLKGRGATAGHARRTFVRQLFPLVSSSVLELLGLRSCQLQGCLAYHRRWNFETSPHLCFECEEALLRKTVTSKDEGASASWQDLVNAAADRYRDLGDVLSGMGDRMEKIRLSRRTYNEFEEDCDWLKTAEELVRESASERKHPLGGKANCRRRSFTNCLRRAHEGQPHRTLKRTFAKPLLTRTCLVDMCQTAPFRHDCGELAKWTVAVTNRKHVAGGHYVELGGSLRRKQIGTFVDSGLNASLAHSGQARLRATSEALPNTWREQRCVPAELPPIRGRLRALEI